jgi:hypothetical protein
VRKEPPRPLTPAESLVLGLLLSTEFPGVEALRAQARSAVVVGRCDCGCPTIELAVPADETFSSDSREIGTLRRRGYPDG